MKKLILFCTLFAIAAGCSGGGQRAQSHSGQSAEAADGGELFDVRAIKDADENRDADNDDYVFEEYEEDDGTVITGGITTMWITSA